MGSEMCIRDSLNTYRVKLEHLKEILVEEEIVDGSLVYEMIASCDLRGRLKPKDATMQAYMDAYDSFEEANEI